MIKAINDIVIIERDGYKGLLIAPKEKMCHGTVLSVGPGAWSANVWDIDPITRSVAEKWRPTSLKQGQRVCFSLDKGEEHIIEGKHVVVMRESHIAGIIENEVINAHDDIGEYRITDTTIEYQTNRTFPFAALPGGRETVKVRGEDKDIEYLLHGFPA